MTTFLPPFRGFRTGAAILFVFTVLAVASCDQRRTIDPNLCSLDDFDATGAQTVGYLDEEYPLYRDVSTKPFKIPNGRWITPIGETTKIHTFPIRVVAHPSGKYFAVNNSGIGDFTGRWQSISFVDAATGGTVGFKHPRCPSGGACDALPVEQIFGDIVFSKDGKKLYAAGGGAQVVRVIDTTKVTEATEVAPIPVPGYPTGLALNAGGDELLVTGFHKNALYRVRLSDGKIVATYPVQLYPYGVTTDGKLAYVSNLGGNSVSKVDLASGETEHMLVGINPEGVALTADGKRLFVANSDSDSVSVIETAGFTTASTITVSLKETPESPPGRSPVDIQISNDGKRAYVVLAGDNGVAVLDTASLEVIGMIPTAWYPTTLVESPDGAKLAVVSAKGFGAGSNDPGLFGIDNPYDSVFVGQLQKGTISIFDTPSDGDLKELEAAVTRNNNVARHLFQPEHKDCERLKGPVPLEVGQPSPIKHVVYIVRENKTYDSNLGDYPGVVNEANGDPSLAIWGKEVTPNLRKIVEQFANHDNYYSEPEQSIQGHIWAAGGWSNDFSEKVWMAMWSNKRDSLFLPAIEHASQGGNGTMLKNILKSGNDIRIYGEISGITQDLTSELRDKYNWKFPAYSLHIRDRDKAKIFIDDLEKGIFPNFVYIWLPNDHTSGCATGRPYPVSEIADNDEATGMVVDAISKSKFWKNTAIFIFEDDPQSAPDHVDGHRSLLAVASPYAKKGWTSHVQLSFPSIHRTMGLMLGVPPTSRYEELATPMYDAFQEEPNLETFDYIPLPENKYVIAKEDDPAMITVGGVQYHNCQEVGAKYLKPNSLDMEDQIPHLGRILWHHARGNEPYPEALIYEEDEDDE